MFAQLDVNNDGRVSQTEFHDAAAARIAIGEMVNDDEEPYELVDTVIGGRWRSRQSEGGGEEIYFDSS